MKWNGTINAAALAIFLFLSTVAHGHPIHKRSPQNVGYSYLPPQTPFSATNESPLQLQPEHRAPPPPPHRRGPEPFDNPHLFKPVEIGQTSRISFFNSFNSSPPVSGITIIPARIVFTSVKMGGDVSDLLRSHPPADIFRVIERPTGPSFISTSPALLSGSISAEPLSEVVPSVSSFSKSAFAEPALAIDIEPLNEIQTADLSQVFPDLIPQVQQPIAVDPEVLLEQPSSAPVIDLRSVQEAVSNVQQLLSHMPEVQSVIEDIPVSVVEVEPLLEATLGDHLPLIHMPEIQSAPEAVIEMQPSLDLFDDAHQSLLLDDDGNTQSVIATGFNPLISQGDSSITLTDLMGINSAAPVEFAHQEILQSSRDFQFGDQQVNPLIQEEVVDLIIPAEMAVLAEEPQQNVLADISSSPEQTIEEMTQQEKQSPYAVHLVPEETIPAVQPVDQVIISSAAPVDSVSQFLLDQGSLNTESLLSQAVPLPPARMVMSAIDVKSVDNLSIVDSTSTSINTLQSHGFPEQIALTFPNEVAASGPVTPINVPSAPVVPSNAFSSSSPLVGRPLPQPFPHSGADFQSGPIVVVTQQAQTFPAAGVAPFQKSGISSQSPQPLQVLQQRPEFFVIMDGATPARAQGPTQQTGVGLFSVNGGQSNAAQPKFFVVPQENVPLSLFMSKAQGSAPLDFRVVQSQEDFFDGEPLFESFENDF